MSLDSTGALQGALAAEHAVIWGYGVVGADVPEQTQPAVRAAEQVHRDRRDSTEQLLRDADATPVAAQPAYELPFPVTDTASALQLAITLETGAAAAWHYLLGQTEQARLRRIALSALTDCAVRAVQWRVAGGLSPASVAFPGQ